ncbi:hypothetical protein KFK09_004765 [Dendrobium nobile]|uniref:J domain-containing protein n=1 Tax=Dendrobium nobile TaxID=94219 RepID=A0A8T3BZF0_DENNO|nr:hypothetical protein KFK09_004765 [Dendrobium nobile]
METYAEIFGGLAASCSIPVLVLPEVMEGFEKELEGAQSSGLNYLEIFGVLDAGTFSLSYDKLLSMEKGLKEKDKEDDRFFEKTDVCQLETEPYGLPEEVPVGHITFSKVNPISSDFHSNFDMQLNFSGRTSQQNIVDEAKNTICVSKPQDNCGPDFKAETTSPTGFVENDGSRIVSSDDHILSGCMEEKKDAVGQRESLNKCLVGATVDNSENDKDAHMHSSKGAACDLKQHSCTNSYHSTLCGDISLSDYAFLTISDINLRTQPLEVPPPLRAPPKLDRQGMHKSEAPDASNITFNNQVHNVGGPRTRHSLKEIVKSTSPIYSNVEVDASKAASAMIEAMEQAQASLNSAKELMERMQDSPLSDRRLSPQDFGFWTEHNIIFSGDSRHKTKMVQKVVPNQAETVTSVFSEDAEEVIQGKDSISYKLSDKKERSHEWKVDKRFYGSSSSEKLTGTGVISGEKYNSNEDIKLEDHRLDACQYFPEKESCGMQGRRFLNGCDEVENVNKSEMLNTFSINENKLFPGGEFQLQDGNTKKLKSIIIDKEEVMNIFETSAIDDEDKEKMVRALQFPNDDIEKLVDPISLIQQDRIENELKQFQDTCICADDKNIADVFSKTNACGRNGSGLVGFRMNRMLEEFYGAEALEEKLEQVKETHLYASDLEDISKTAVVFEYDALRKVDNCNITSEFGVNKKLREAKLSSLQNAFEVEVHREHRTSFSCEEENGDANSEECQLGMLKQTKKETYASCNDGKDSELGGIVNTSEQENRSFSGIEEIVEPVKKQRAKWNIPNRSELNGAKLSIRPIYFEMAKEESEFQKNEEKNVYELLQKLENSDARLTTDGEQRKDEKKILGKVQAALELEKKIMGFNAIQQVFQGKIVQDSKAAQRTNSLDNKGNIMSPFVDTSGSSWKQMDKSIHDEWRDANNTSKEILDRKRKQEADQKRELVEKERVREREKYMIAVEKVTRDACEMVFVEDWERAENIVSDWVATEARHQPITVYQDIIENSSSEAFERSEKVANYAKLPVQRPAVERATAEGRERAIERGLAEQVSHEARREAETSGNCHKDKNWKHNEAEDIVRPGNEDSEKNPRPTFDVIDAPFDMKSQSDGCEGESPLRCKARQERRQRIVERAAKALAEKNMRDLLAQREQAERNRLAETLDAEVRRWSSGKEGNLRALLSTLQYILGNESGWQPIPLTEVITAAAVRKAYRKATLYVHPDKLQQRGATIQNKYICEKVFDLLKDAWIKFNSEGR